jgi:hypothetical protein
MKSYDVILVHPKTCKHWIDTIEIKEYMLKSTLIAIAQHIAGRDMNIPADELHCLAIIEGPVALDYWAPTTGET